MNYKDTKELCDKILIEEIEINNLNIYPYIFGKLNYYNSNFFKRKLFLSMITHIDNDLKTYIKLPFNIKGGYLHNEKWLIVFIKQHTIPIIFDNDIVKILHILYHEIYHAIDFSNYTDMLDYNNFSSYIDLYIRELLPNEQKKYHKSRKSHNSFMFEILANLYAMEKIKRFIKHNPNIYKYNFKYLSKKEEQYHRQYNEYNLVKHLNLVIDNYSLFLNDKSFNKMIFNVFLNEKGEFHTINDIMNNPLINGIDIRIISAFFRTNLFKDSINISELNPEESFYLERVLTMNNILNKEEKIKIKFKNSTL